MAFNLSSLNKQLAKMSPTQRAKFNSLLKKNEKAKAAFTKAAKTASMADAKKYGELIKPSNKELYSSRAKNYSVKKPIDDMSGQERPAELAGKEIPYNFKGETKPWTRPTGTSGLGAQATPQIEDETYGYKGFRAMGEDEDPIEYENAKLKDELSSVSRWAVDAVNAQKLDIGTFKDTIQKNADMWKNKTQLNADNLFKQKAANDKAWEAVQAQFDENQAAQKAALDKLETEFIKRQAERDNLQRQYYNDVNKVLGNKAAGEGAGLTSQLSGKGLNAAMIANATAGVDKKYQERFAMAKDNHLNALENLQNGYTDFYKSLNANKRELGADAEQYVKSVYDREKGFNKDFKDLKDKEVEGMYKPIGQWFDKLANVQTDQGANTAKKIEKAAEYEAASPETRRNILLDNLVKIGKGMEMTKLDMDILETAAGMGSFSKALMYIAKQGKAAASAGDNSNIGSYIKDNGVNTFIQDAIKGNTSVGTGTSGEGTKPSDNDTDIKSDSTTKVNTSDGDNTQSTNIPTGQGKVVEGGATINADLKFPEVDITLPGVGDATNLGGTNLTDIQKDPEAVISSLNEKPNVILQNWASKRIHSGMSLDDFKNLGEGKDQYRAKYNYIKKELAGTKGALDRLNSLEGYITTPELAAKRSELLADMKGLKNFMIIAGRQFANAF